MESKTAFILSIALGGALLLLARQAQAYTIDYNDSSNGEDGSLPDFSTGDSTMDADAQIQALLDTIGRFESNGDYTILYGGGHFNDFSHHPNIRVPINLPGYEGKVSTAAGKYQINYPTYLEYAARRGITDFSPQSQEILGRDILQSTGAIDALLNGDLPGAFRLAAKRWASMPGSTANQRPQTLATVSSYFNSLLA